MSEYVTFGIVISDRAFLRSSSGDRNKDPSNELTNNDGKIIGQMGNKTNPGVGDLIKD